MAKNLLASSQLQEAISVIETDCEVDFAPPLDYVEPVRQPLTQPGAAAEEEGPSGEAEEEEEPKFQAFKGSGRRLDGKPSASPSAPTSQPAASTSGRKPGVLIFLSLCMEHMLTCFAIHGLHKAALRKLMMASMLRCLYFLRRTTRGLNLDR